LAPDSSLATPDATVVRPGPALGVDLGTRRVGIAVSDSGRVLARPLVVLLRTGDVAADHEAIAGLVEECGATIVVVGLPISLSGEEGSAARRAREEIEVLRTRLAVPVVAKDERLSTVEATRRLKERAPGARVTRGGAKRGGPRRPVVDDLAAAIILQAWLDTKDPRR
jgi:putative Holliday junction resolvase